MFRRYWTIALSMLLITLAACGGGGEQGAGATQPAGSDESTATTGAPSAATGGIHSAETDVGTVLVDGDGFALYAFTPDSAGESTCYDECADLWPPIPGDASIGEDLDGSKFGTTTRDDGSEQLTVNGQPLYAYTADTNPGEATGHGVNDVWFAVAPDGTIIGGTPDTGATTTTAPTDDGYSY